MTSPPILAIVDIEDTQQYVRLPLSVYIACSLTSNENRIFKNGVLANTARIFEEAGFKVRNPGAHTPPGSPHLPTEVYFEDLFRTISSDFIFFLRLGRSHGMGIEAQLAADLLLPWADAQISDESYSLTPMLAGLANAPGTRFTLSAAAPDQFYARLAQFLRDPARITHLVEARGVRDRVLAFLHDSRIGYHVRVHRLALGLSAGELAAVTGIDPTWIEAIETDSRFAAKLTLMQVAQLSDALEMKFEASHNEMASSFPKISIVGTSVIPYPLIDAAKTFADYSLTSASPSTRRPLDERVLLLQWKDFLATKDIAVVEGNPQRLSNTTGPVRVFLCYPLSNVLPQERLELEGLVVEVTNSLRSCGIEVEIETPKFQGQGRQDHGPEIYLDRIARLRRTDLAIAFLDPASTGVGIMLQLMHNATVPCVCIAKKEAQVSRMVRGLAPLQLPIIEYSSAGTVGSHLTDWLAEHVDAIRQSRARRDRAWTQLGGLYLRRAITLTQIVDANVVAMPLFREQFWTRLQSCDDLTGPLTLFQLAYIAIVQEWNVVPSSSDFLAFEPHFALPDGVHDKKMTEAAAHPSLCNLWEAMQQGHADKSRARQAWSAYLAELSLNAARNEKKTKTVANLIRSVEDWLRVLRAKDEL